MSGRETMWRHDVGRAGPGGMGIEQAESGRCHTRAAPSLRDMMQPLPQGPTPGPGPAGSQTGRPRLGSESRARQAAKDRTHRAVADVHTTTHDIYMICIFMYISMYIILLDCIYFYYYTILHYILHYTKSHTISHTILLYYTSILCFYIIHQYICTYFM